MMSSSRRGSLRWIIAGVALGVSASGVGIAAAAADVGDPQRVADANSLVQFAEELGYADAKDPLTAWLSNCLESRGAIYDPATGYMYYSDGETAADSVALMACLDQLVAAGRD